ncbi:MAG: hypothetical protein DLM55_11865 [Acidimicrobiales bacterium]|nr:MAG: hypothetical protein DLM55_11865 [Acidimicrobiales bacterium]
MGHNFRFFVTPEEFASVVDAIAEKTGAKLWSFPEAAMTGGISQVKSLVEGQRSLIWFGVLPSGCTVWNSYEAATEAGFVCLVRPEVDSPAETVYLGEVFTPASNFSGSLFLPVKRALAKLLVCGTFAVSDCDPKGKEVKGPKCSKGALALHEAGYVMRQSGVALVIYLPSCPKPM